MTVAALLAGLLLGQPASGEAWLDATLEILNPAATDGRRLLTVGEVVGPEAQPAGGDRVNLVALVRVEPVDCADAEGLCERLIRGVSGVARSTRALVVLVVVPPAGSEDRARALVTPFASSQEVVGIAFDARGLAAHVSGLAARGDATVVFADGRRIRTRTGEGDEAAAPLLRALRGP